jgi:hypothetical protein
LQGAYPIGRDTQGDALLPPTRHWRDRFRTALDALPDRQPFDALFAASGPERELLQLTDEGWLRTDAFGSLFTSRRRGQTFPRY